MVGSFNDGTKILKKPKNSKNNERFETAFNCHSNGLDLNRSGPFSMIDLAVNFIADKS